MSSITSRGVVAALTVSSLIGENYALRHLERDNLVYSRPIPFLAPTLLLPKGNLLILSIWASIGQGFCSYAQGVPRTQQNRNFHRFCSAFDHVSNLVVKIANTWLIFQCVKGVVNDRVAAAAGCATLALSLYNAKLAYEYLHEIRGDRVE